MVLAVLVHFSDKQMGLFVEAQLRRWRNSVVTLLRECFPQRLEAVDDDALRRLCVVVRRQAAHYEVSSEADLTRYAIGATLLGVGFVEDWQFSWLFNEQYSPTVAAEGDSYNFSTMLANLERAVADGLVSEGPNDGFRDSCQRAEKLVLEAALNPVVAYADALRCLNADKVEWLGPQRVARFVEDSVRRAEQLGRGLTARHVLLAWLFGGAFMQDPLCHQAATFLMHGTDNSGA